MIAIFLMTLLTGLCTYQTDQITLLPPTGPYPVGTTLYEWAYNSDLPIKGIPHSEKRRLVTQVWYPARKHTTSLPAPYAAHSKGFEQVATHSFVNLPFDEALGRTKLILIVPGRGMASYLYTSLAQDLASRGFVVAAVDMPYIGMTTYQDSSIITPSDLFRTPPGMMAGPYGKVDAFFEFPTALGISDLEVVMEQLKVLNRAGSKGLFNGHLDLDSIGVFGHSLGGRIAGGFAAKNPAVHAYVAMEGISPRDVRYGGKLKIPSLMLCSRETWPYAKINYEAFIEHRGGPVSKVVLDDFGHNSLTDVPSIKPSQYAYVIEPSEAIRLGRQLLTGFFEQKLQGRSDDQADLWMHPKITRTFFP